MIKTGTLKQSKNIQLVTEMTVADGLALISRQGTGNHQDDVGRSVHSE